MAELSHEPELAEQPVHEEPWHTHLVPDSQQCCLSGQQHALADGQQPAPAAVTQQVSPDWHGLGEQPARAARFGVLATGRREPCANATRAKRQRTTSPECILCGVGEM
jgi:hypothetical protein